MNIEELCKKALTELKTKYSSFPKTGFIAGGSIGNLVWEYVSGNRAIINDIDVFVFGKIIDKIIEHKYVSDMTEPNNRKKLSYIQREVKYYEDYKGLASTSEAKEFYIIDGTSTDGIYNTINYSANSKSPGIILNSFDINCTQVGYSIDEDKFYWTTHFEEFIKTGSLKLTNILSPSHSAIRLYKKKEELNATLDPLEIKMCQYSLSKGMSDTNRTCFSEKYAKMYIKYISELEKYFTISMEPKVMDFFIKQKNLNIKIFTLRPISGMYHHSGHDTEIFNDPSMDIIWRGKDLLYYVRNIMGDENATKIWKNLRYLMQDKNYIDADVDHNDVEMLGRLIEVAPKTIENIKGLSLSKQIRLMKTLFDKYKEDPIVSISIFEKIKLDPDSDFDETDLLLLELSVRKEILNDTQNKVGRILKMDKNTDPSLSLNLDFL